MLHLCFDLIRVLLYFFFLSHVASKDCNATLSDLFLLPSFHLWIYVTFSDVIKIQRSHSFKIVPKA